MPDWDTAAQMSLTTTKQMGMFTSIALLGTLFLTRELAYGRLGPSSPRAIIPAKGQSLAHLFAELGEIHFFIS